jgi:hypothetical protein
MNVPTVQRVSQVKRWHRNSAEKELDLERVEKSKITIFVLKRLGSSNAFVRETKLPEAFASKIMMDVLSSMAEQVQDQNPSERRFQIQGKKPRDGEFLAPIGLRSSDSYPWINAWMQFLIHLPKFTELISFVGKSFNPFRVIVDQYMVDQKSGLGVSIADSSSLISCLLKIYPVCLSRFSNPIDFCEIFRFFFKSLFSPIALGRNMLFCDSIVFHPEWFVVLDNQDHMQKVLASHPSEIMIAFTKDTLCRPQRQYFLNKGRCFYDLDAFIESRPDPKGVHYITYVRIDGIWYQCEDEKIRYISSRTVNVPLSRGVIFHYRRAGI